MSMTFLRPERPEDPDPGRFLGVPVFFEEVTRLMRLDEPKPIRSRGVVPAGE